MPPVLLSFVLRLVPDALASGRLVGQVENVASGERAVVRSSDDLLTFVQRSSPEAPNGPMSLDREETP